MKKPIKQAPAGEIHSLQQLYQNGQLSQLESQAKQLLKSYPKALPVLNLLAMSLQGQGRLKEAATQFQKIVAIQPDIAEIQFNLAAIQTELGQIPNAIAGYRKAVKLKPEMTVAHFNLATLYQQQGLNTDAIRHYQQALNQQPGFFQAWSNQGTLLQQQGDLLKAEQCYRQALSLNADAQSHSNLGTVLYAQGRLDDALESFQQALHLNPQFADAWNHLGEIHRDRGNMDEAMRCYRQALTWHPDHARANYNLGESYDLAGELERAIPYFDASSFADASERVLQCLYKTRQFEVFKQKLDQQLKQKNHHSVLLGALSTHYAINFHQDNAYRFCRHPMDYVQLTHIDELSDPNHPLLAELLADVKNLQIAERKQGRLYYGMQSAGNLLLRAESSFQQLAQLLLNKVKAYRKQFAHSSDMLIRSFPDSPEFASSWYLRMNQGGYLTSHIHEEGWISGCVYLQLPDKGTGHEGSFEYSVDGDDYPKLHDDFPARIVDQSVGDLVLFPSSLFHRTRPFHSDQERVCIAFDIKPAPR